MISVPVPKEITEYKEKIIFGLSFRQLICIALAIVTGIVTYLFCTFVLKLPLDISGYVVMIAALPAIALGFIRKNGLPFEKYALLFLRAQFGTCKLPYQEKALFCKVAPKKDLTKERKSNVRTKTRKNLKTEYLYAPTKGGRKKALKAARRSVKAAQQELRQAVIQAEKGAEESCSTQNRPRRYPLSAHGRRRDM